MIYGTAIRNLLNSFCIPMVLTIQDGLAKASSWIGGNLSSPLSHALQIIRNGRAIAQTFSENAYFSLDRCFPTVPLLMELKRLNESAVCRLHAIASAKANCAAYAKPEMKPDPCRGRPCKKGKSIKAMDLFESRRHDFITSTVFMCGKEQKAECLSLNPLWGVKLYQELQFALVKYGNATTILSTADLELAPTLVIEAYAHRFKIEQMFHEMKQQIHGFSYHFWNSKIPKLNKHKKKSEPDPLTAIRKEDRPSVLLTEDGLSFL
jgi:hypothetical protein